MSWDKFKETQLPLKESFYSKLNMSSISDEDYEHAQKVWSAFDMKNLGEYHDKTNVILRSNMFENLGIPAWSVISSIRLISIHCLDWLGKQL